MALTAPTVTGFSGFWNLQGDKLTYSMSQSQGRAKDAWRIARTMRGYPAKDAAAAFNVLIGAVAGPTITATAIAVPLPPGPQQTVPVVTGIGDFGGIRNAVTTNVINRASTAADVTELKRWVANNALLESGITYPAFLGSSMARGAMHANMPGFST